MDPEMQSKLDTALAEAAKYKKDAKAYKKDVKALRKANEKMESEMAEFAELVAKAKADLSRISSLENELETARQELSAAQHATAQEDESSAAAEQISDLTARLASAEGQAEKLRASNDELQSKLEAANQHGADVDAKYLKDQDAHTANEQAATARIAALEAEAKAGEAEREAAQSAADASIANLRKEIDEKGAALEAAHASLAAAKTEWDGKDRLAQAEQERLSSEITALSKKCDAVQAENNDLTAAHQKSSEQMALRVTELEAAVAQANAALTQERATVASLTQDVTSWQQKCEVAEAAQADDGGERALQLVNARVAELEASLAEKNDALTSSKDEAASHKARAESLAQDLAARESALADATSRVSQVETELTTLQDQVSEATAARDAAVEASRAASEGEAAAKAALAASEQSLVDMLAETEIERARLDTIKAELEQARAAADAASAEARAHAERVSKAEAQIAAHAKTIADFEAKNSADASNAETESKQLVRELEQLRAEHAEISEIYITAQQERDTATAKASALENQVESLTAALEAAQTEANDLKSHVAAAQTEHAAVSAEALTAETQAKEAALAQLAAVQAELAEVRSTFTTRFEAAKADIKASKAEARSQRKARQRIETEISELAEAVAVERAQISERERELDNMDARHAAEVQELRESIELMRQLHEGGQAKLVDTEVQTEEPWPSVVPPAAGSAVSTSAGRKDSGERGLDGDGYNRDGNQDYDAHQTKSPKSPEVLEQSAWCSWERASVRRLSNAADSPGRSRNASPLPVRAPKSQHLAPPTALPSNGTPQPAAVPTMVDPDMKELIKEMEAQVLAKDEEIKFLQRALMKNVELAAITKKEENELRREYKTCKNQLDLLVALENEDEEAAAKLRQDIVTAKYRAMQAKLSKELKEARQQIVDLQEMLMLQRQVRFERTRSVSPTQAPAAARPKLRTVRLEREPGRQLGIMLNEDPDQHFKELGVRVAGVRKGSIADESNQVYMGDAIVSINNVWCFKSSFREVINFMKNTGDLITLKLASAVDVGGCTGDEPFLQPGGDNGEGDDASRAD
eukprot:m.51862 g.51862  ORF g.51862 m.51862 type:complete len:1058 (-) comp7339_c0_seq1:141-3314(-)